MSNVLRGYSADFADVHGDHPREIDSRGAGWATTMEGREKWEKEQAAKREKEEGYIFSPTSFPVFLLLFLYVRVVRFLRE